MRPQLSKVAFGPHVNMPRQPASTHITSECPGTQPKFRGAPLCCTRHVCWAVLSLSRRALHAMARCAALWQYAKYHDDEV